MLLVVIGAPIVIPLFFESCFVAVPRILLKRIVLIFFTQKKKKCRIDELMLVAPYRVSLIC